MSEAYLFSFNILEETSTYSLSLSQKCLFKESEYEHYGTNELAVFGMKIKRMTTGDQQ